MNKKSIVSIVLWNFIIKPISEIESCNVYVKSFPEKGNLLKTLMENLNKHPNIIAKKTSWLDNFKKFFNKHYTPISNYSISAFMDGRIWENQKYKGGELFAQLHILNTSTGKVTVIEDSVMETNNFNVIIPKLANTLTLKIMEIVK